MFCIATGKLMGTLICAHCGCAELFNVEQSSKANEHRNGFNYKIIITVKTYLGKIKALLLQNS